MKLIKGTITSAAFFWAQCVAADVSIQYAGNVISYENNPRLSAVLSRLVLSKEFYWHSASLYRLNSQSMDSELKRLNDLLAKVKAETGVKTEKMVALLAIEHQIAQWRLAERLPLIVDYDLIRIREELNPRLESGDYYLHLPFREYEVSIVGAVAEVGRVAHIAAQSVDKYLEKKNISFLSYADTNVVYIIHPTGRVKRIPLGLHNSSHNEVPPGGTIYIPLKELPFSKVNSELNELVAKLAGSRLP